MMKKNEQFQTGGQESESQVQTAEFSRAEGNFEVYKDLEGKVESHPELKKLLDAVLEAGMRYSKTIWAHADASRRMREGEIEFESRHIVEKSDEARRIAHNSLVDQMNIFSRACNNESIDISSIRDIVTGGSREAIRVKIAQFVLDVLDQIALEKDKQDKERGRK